MHDLFIVNVRKDKSVETEVERGRQERRWRVMLVSAQFPSGVMKVL